MYPVVRQTNVKDAEWIAQLGRCGLIEPSYIPDPEVVQLRLLTRRMRSYKQCQTIIWIHLFSFFLLYKGMKVFYHFHTIR